MFMRITEVTCDYKDCQGGQTIHVGRLEDARKEYGFVFTRDGKHFLLPRVLQGLQKNREKCPLTIGLRFDIIEV